MEKPELRILLPDGSLKEVVERLLADAGLAVKYRSSRTFRGLIRSDFVTSVQLSVFQLRPWDMGPVVRDGYAHLAVAADDMLWNSGCVDGQDVTILDHYPLARAGGEQTRLVIAVPHHSEIKNIALLRGHRLATEYVQGAMRWLAEQGISEVEVLGCHGKLEVFHHLGVDAILANVETGDSLTENSWRTIYEIMASRTCLFANSQALKDPTLGPVISSIRLLLNAVTAARSRTMVTCNVSSDNLKRHIEQVLQSQIGTAQRPTVSDLVGGGHAVEALVPTQSLCGLIVELESAGATAIVALPCSHFIP